MKSKPVVLQLAITCVIALVLGFFVGFTAFYHIHSFDRALMNYVHNPTPETKSALRVEQAKITHMRVIDSLEGAFLFFFVANFIFSLNARRKRLASLSLLAAFSTLVVYVGIPSFPVNRGGGSNMFVFDIWFGDGAVQVTVFCGWFIALVGTVAIFTCHHLRIKRPVS